MTSLFSQRMRPSLRAMLRIRRAICGPVAGTQFASSRSRELNTSIFTASQMRIDQQITGTATELSVLAHPLWVNELITYQLDQTIGRVASLRARTSRCDRSNTFHVEPECAITDHFDPHSPSVDELAAVLMAVGSGNISTGRVSRAIVGRLAELDMIEGNADSMPRLTSRGRNTYNRLVGIDNV